MENEPDARDAMDWLIDDELMRNGKRREVKLLQVEKVQSAPGLLVAQA